MKKYLLALLLLTSVFAVASETDFVQFTTEAYNTYSTPGQNWPDARMITLKVPAGSIVYLTSKTRSWNETIPNLADTDYTDKWGQELYNEIGFDMSENKYGYVYAKIDNGNASPDGGIHLADGTTKELTLTDGTNSRVATGYLLGEFKDAAEIFLVMTPLGYESTIDTYNPVLEGDNSALQSRHVNYVDFIDAKVVNLGTTDGVGHEFIIGYVADTTPAPSGQPLPGVLTSCLVGLAATSIAARRRKHSKK